VKRPSKAASRLIPCFLSEDRSRGSARTPCCRGLRWRRIGGQPCGQEFFVASDQLAPVRREPLGRSSGSRLLSCYFHLPEQPNLFFWRHAVHATLTAHVRLNFYTTRCNAI
jgi:hypothetical protein